MFRLGIIFQYARGKECNTFKVDNGLLLLGSVFWRGIQAVYYWYGQGVEYRWGGDFVCIGCKLPSKKELRDNTVFRNGSGVTIGMKIFLTEKIYLSTMGLMINFHFSSRTPF